MIIHLNGMPGVGKLTVAKVLAEQLNARLIDNHLAIDLVTSLCDRGPLYFKTLRKFNELIFGTLLEKEPGERYIFTNALAENFDGDVERFNAIRDFAKKRGAVFVPITLTCSVEQNLARVTAEDRGNKGKLRDTEILKEMVKKYTIYHPVDEPFALSIDTTHLKPEETAGKVMAYMHQQDLLDAENHKLPPNPLPNRP